MNNKKQKTIKCPRCKKEIKEKVEAGKKSYICTCGYEKVVWGDR